MIIFAYRLIKNRMATIKFRLSSKADKTSGQCEVLVRFFHGHIDQYAKTNVFVSPEHWDKARGCNIIPRVRVMTPENKSLVTTLTEQNNRLADITKVINDKFIEAGAGKVAMPGSWLADVLQDYNFKGWNIGADEETLFNVFDSFIENKIVSATRKRNFQVANRAFQRYCLFENITPTFENITANVIRGFADYLKEEHTFYCYELNADGDKVVKYLNPRFKRAIELVPESRMPGERGQNFVSELLGRLRQFFHWAVDNGRMTSNPFKDVEVPGASYGTPFYITIAERNAIFHCDLSSRPQLAIQRDIFVFQCVIGCRVSDLQRLRKTSIVNGAVEYIPRKTKEGNPVTVRVPLNSVAKEIVERYKDFPGNKLLPFISDQKYNNAIKEVFKIAGVDRMVTVRNSISGEDEQRPICDVASSHMARRCFIGNLYKQVKDQELVSKLSGHKEGSRAFARYRDIDEEMRVELVTMIE